MNHPSPLLSDLPDVPELSWLKRLFRRRSLLTYYLQDQRYQVWVCNFYEKNDRCIIYQDYATKQATVIKSDQPLVYTLTESR